MEAQQPSSFFSWQKPPTLFECFKRNPALFVAQYFYARKVLVSSPQTESHGWTLHQPIKVVCIADTHNTVPDVPDGEIFLHAGDLTNKGTFEEIQAQLTWLSSLPHKHKVAIGGNHDLLLDPEYVDKFPERNLEREGSARKDLDWGDIKYLDNKSLQISISGRAINIYGNPQMPYCGNWAFQYPPIRNVWKDIVPAETDILLTHTPPKGHLDSDGKGCEWLLREIWQKKPRLVAFGHIHRGRGHENVAWDFVQKAYDGIWTGENGVFSVFMMVVVLGYEWVKYLLTGKEKKCIATFVNAAVVAGSKKTESNSIIVVNI